MKCTNVLEVVHVQIISWYVREENVLRRNLWLSMHSCVYVFTCQILIVYLGHKTVCLFCTFEHTVDRIIYLTKSCI